MNRYQRLCALGILLRLADMASNERARTVYRRQFEAMKGR